MFVGSITCLRNRTMSFQPVNIQVSPYILFQTGTGSGSGGSKGSGSVSIPVIEL